MLLSKLRNIMRRIYFMLLSCLIISSLTACGHKGPPRLPKDESLTKTELKYYPSTLAKNRSQLKLLQVFDFKKVISVI